MITPIRIAISSTISQDCDLISGTQGDPGPGGGEGSGVLGDAELLVAPLPRLRHRRGCLCLEVVQIYP